MRSHSFIEFVLAVAERHYARSASRAMLAWYRRVRRRNEQLNGRSLYERILVERSGLDPMAAAGILVRSEQSFCEWPVRRQLRYRDVVHYVLVEEYLDSHRTLRGTLTNMGAVVSRVIPPEL